MNKYVIEERNVLALGIHRCFCNTLCIDNSVPGNENISAICQQSSQHSH